MKGKPLVLAPLFDFKGGEGDTPSFKSGGGGGGGRGLMGATCLSRTVRQVSPALEKST